MHFYKFTGEAIEGNPERRRVVGEETSTWTKVGAKAWFGFSQSTSQRNSTECPGQGRNEKSIILIHVGNLIFAGGSKYINEICLSKDQGKFDASVSKIERMGGDFNFLRTKYQLEVDGSWIQPGNYIQHMLKAYEDQIGPVKLQQLPADNSRTEV